MKINAIEIKNFRNKYRLTQSELAELVGVSYRTIQNYEKGVPIPKSKVQLFQRIFEGYKDTGSEVREELLEGKRRAATGLTIEDVSLDEIARFVIIHDTELMKNKIFKTYITSKQAAGAFKFLAKEMRKLREDLYKR